MSKPKIIHIYSGAPKDDETKRRYALAKASWNAAESYYKNWIECDLSNTQFPRNATKIGDPAPLPFIHDMVNEAIAGAGDSDIIFLTNADICVYPEIGDEIARICEDKGSCYAYRWDFERLDALLTKEDIPKGRWYIGCDGFAFTKKWWTTWSGNYPDFVLGRETWDWIMRALISETGGGELQKAIYHETHQSPWKIGRLYQPGNLYNRSYARAWLEERGLALREIANAPFNKVEWKSKVILAKTVYVKDGPRHAPMPATKSWGLFSPKRQEPESYAPLGLDVLIVLGRGSKWENNELRYCLRSLEKHAKNMGRIYVVGQDPGFLNPEHVTMVKREDFGRNKEHNIAEHCAWAAEKLPITEHFLWVNDDMFFLQDTDISTYPYYNDGELQPKWERAKPGGYRVALTQTDAQLKAHRKPTRNYEVHVPIIYSRRGFSQPEIKRFLNLASKVPFGMTFRSVYCNVLGIKPGPDYRDMKLGNVATAEELKAKTQGRHCFSIGDGLTDDAKKYFLELFPDKSRFEA